MTKQTPRTKNTENIEFFVSIGEFKLRLSLPKHTTVGGLIAIVKGYDVLHQEYGPQGMPFIGLGSSHAHAHPLIDYWLTQHQLDFTSFRRKLQLKSLYAFERRSDKICIGEFEFLVCLGKGAHGAVYLVRNRLTGALVALKRVEKQTISNYQGLMNQFRQRKNLMKMSNNPYTVNFHACFESKHHFNFLMDYYPGGQLFLHLSGPRRQKLTSQSIKTYFCQILLAMEYIHRKKVLYRDLKPENIFVDIRGHLRIGDFGMSKCDFEEEDFTASLCGSEEYMAPEILENVNYNFSSDFYSIGAILYEFLTGVPPYYNECQNFKHLHNGDKYRLELIKNMTIDFTKVTTNVHLRQLLANLLHPDPNQRISNFQEIKNSPWLSGVDWKVIEHKTEAMPFAVDPCAPVDAYIGKQFLNLQAQVEQINMNFEDEYFMSDISEAFEYIRPESKKILGLEQEIHIVKPKAKGSLKERKEKYPRRANLSIALFDREQTNSDSICSEPKTTKGDNKQNLGPLRKDKTKKTVVNLSKQASSANFGKIGLQAQTPMMRQKTERGLLAQFNQNYSECSSRNASECAIRLPSECSSKRQDQRPLKKGTSRGRELGRGSSRDLKIKGLSKQKSLKEASLSKHNLMKRKEQKRMLPTMSGLKIKLS